MPHAEDDNRPLAAPGPPPLSRRDLLLWGGAVAAGVMGSLGVDGPAAHAAPSAANAVASTFSPLRPPATPLAVRSPYLTTWLAGDSLAGTWPTFWNGRITALAGIARIDGTPYVFLGAPALPGGPALNTMTQTSLQLTATRSIFTLTGGGVMLTVTFFSPVDLGNLQRQSVPLSYVSVQAASDDGASHTVDVHVDASAEWVHGDSATQVAWAKQATGSMTALTCRPSSPTELSEKNDQASWGSLVLAAPTVSGLTWQIGQDTVVRAASATNGTLAGTSDTAQPRAINDRWPVLGLNQNLGTVTASAPSAAFQLVVGHVRTPAVSYLGSSLNPWWTHYWSSWTAMLDWFNNDRAAAVSAAVTFDTAIHDDAVSAAGGGDTGQRYAAVCALAVRQAVAGTELVDRNGAPWAMLKEISSNGNFSTVDVLYPASPAYLHLSPAYLRLLLEPHFDYAEKAGWPKPYAEHDLGSSYPNATGHLDGNEEAMPIEESANMLIMAAAVAQRLPAADAASFATAHYAILRKWAEYLVANTLDPENQNQTDDFTGWIAHSANLALKGIIGVGAMSVVAKAASNSPDASHYEALARGYISRWVTLAQDSSGTHLKLAYDRDGTWSLKYNGYADRLLGVDLVPTGVAAQEAAWYLSRAGTYGVLLDPRNDYTKTDWEVWTAAWLADHADTRDMLINGVYGFANSTPSRVPFTDWYVVATDAQRGFADRPVIGGVLALMNAPAADSVSWKRIQNKNSGKLLAVSGMSLADSAEVTQYEDNGTADHQWTVVDNGDGTVKIYNRNSGKLLAVHDQSTADGAHVQQYNDNGTQDHLWRFVDNGDGWMKIVNVHSGRLMAVDGASQANGAQVTQWNDNGTSDHLWRLV